MTRPAVPVVEGLFEIEGGAVRLKGARCSGCGAVFFPAVSSCRDPGCPDPKVVPASIEGRGVLYSYTVQNYRPPVLFGMEPWAPYAIGAVDLPDGLRVIAMLSGAVEDIRIGMPVLLAVKTLSGLDGGAEVVTHVFEPDPDGGATT